MSSIAGVIVPNNFPIKISQKADPSTGSFSGVSAAPIGTTIGTIDLSTVTGSAAVRVTLAASNTGLVQSEFYEIVGSFLRVGASTFVKSGGSTIATAGNLGEAPPTLELDAGNVIKIQKAGSVTSVWGGKWEFVDSGL